MKHIFTIFIGVCLSCCWSSCTPDIDSPIPQAASLDVSRIAVIGSDIAAGISNSEMRQGPGLPTTLMPHGGYYAKAQQYNFGHIIGKQLSQIGAPPFIQPEVSEKGSGHLDLASLAPAICEDAPLRRVMTWAEEDFSWLNPVSFYTPMHNMAIPRLRLQDIESSPSQSSNPYLLRLMLDGPYESYFDWVADTEPTLSFIWLGVEDILYHAYNGAGTRNPFPLSEPAAFYDQYDRLLKATLKDPNAVAVILNIPDVTTFPFFHETPTVQYVPDSNCQVLPLYTWDDQTNESKMLSEKDQILMSAEYRLATQGGTYNNPLPGKLVLSEAEISMIRQYTRDINTSLANLANTFNTGEGSPRVVIVDMHALYTDLQEGMYADGASLSNEYLQGGFFSIDGLTPCPRGQALIANTVMQKLTETYPGTHIPLVSLTDYPSVRVR